MTSIGTQLPHDRSSHRAKRVDFLKSNRSGNEGSFDEKPATGGEGCNPLYRKGSDARFAVI
jgi:hypothetical protein